jgi:hypothetical protein
MLNENRAWVMSILKDSESSRKIDCVINTVETASRLIVHAINILNLSVFRTATGKAVSFISYFCFNDDAAATRYILPQLYLITP